MQANPTTPRSKRTPSYGNVTMEKNTMGNFQGGHLTETSPEKRNFRARRTNNNSPKQTQGRAPTSKQAHEPTLVRSASVPTTTAPALSSEPRTLDFNDELVLLTPKHFMEQTSQPITPKLTGIHNLQEFILEHSTKVSGSGNIITPANETSPSRKHERSMSEPLLALPPKLDEKSPSKTTGISVTTPGTPHARWAGPAFSNTPPPSSLPIPIFVNSPPKAKSEPSSPISTSPLSSAVTNNSKQVVTPANQNYNNTASSRSPHRRTTSRKLSFGMPPNSQEVYSSDRSSSSSASSPASSPVPSPPSTSPSPSPPLSPQMAPATVYPSQPYQALLPPTLAFHVSPQNPDLVQLSFGLRRLLGVDQLVSV